jgi:cytolysin-activating lysine-acyltransferase
MTAAATVRENAAGFSPGHNHKESNGSATEQAAPKPAQPAAPGMDAALGQVVWLMMNTPAFRHMFLADLEWMVLPPILLGQFRIMYDGGKPVAFAAWGYLSEEAEARLQQPNPRLQPNDWKSGDRLWLVSVIAPFGHGEKMLEDVRRTALAGKSFKFHRHQPDGRRTAEVVNAPPASIGFGSGK